MTFILGFGSTETEVRREVMNALAAGQDADSLQAELNSKADAYDKMPRTDAPERYTRIYVHDDTIVFQHINRRHALAPDGWALLEVTTPRPSTATQEVAA